MNDLPPSDDSRRPGDTPLPSPSGETDGGEPTAPLWAPPGTHGADAPLPPQGPPQGAPQGQPQGQPQSQPFGQQGPSQPAPQGPPPTRPLYGPYGQGPFGQSEAATPAKPRRSRRAGFAAGVVAASLIVGGGAGIGGAALYNSQHDSGSGDIPAAHDATSSSVVNDKAPSGSVEKVAAKVLPSVVKIEVSGSQESGSGSGIILSSDGEILTNNHVVEVAGQNGTIKVDFNDGTSAEAKILGTDPLTDTAVIKADNVSGLKPATIGQSHNLAVGQSVVAIGSPFGLDSTVTSGIVSALNRPVNVGSDSQGNATVYPAIQTDAAINPGNSGGALVDMNGNVVGINASIRSTGSVGGEAGSIGLGFAIPIDEVRPIIKQMIEGDTPTHARLGITVSNAGQQQSQDSGLFDGDGAKVEQITDGSAAQKAGLAEGDVITKVGDQQITGSDSLVATIRAYRPGDKVKVTWTHDGKTKTATIVLDSDDGGSKS